MRLNYLTLDKVAVKSDSFRALLATRGRKTGREHQVWLRAVSYNEMIYFSRRNEDSDWLKNAIANPVVRVEFEGKAHIGSAALVTDEILAKKISELKYPGEDRAHETRIVLQIVIKD